MAFRLFKMAARNRGCVFFLAIACVGMAIFNPVGARRYRSCEEGCCIHEYCAYHRICYPKIHCRFGCPDGTCIGEEENTDTKNQPTSNSLPQPTTKTPIKFAGRIGLSPLVKGRSNHGRSSPLPQIEAKQTPQQIPILRERYVNQKDEIIPPSHNAARFAESSKAHNPIFAHAAVSPDVPGEGATGLAAQKETEPAQPGLYSFSREIAKELPAVAGNGGICMPTPPCKVGQDCGMGHVCAFNYNLGYPTCQYNLDIGSTLCYDKDGQLKLQPSS